MSLRAALPVLVFALLGGCIPQVVTRDRESACRVARSLAQQPLSAVELVQVTTPFPVAHRYARRAYHARMAALVLTGIGAAGLVGAFVTGFATDTSQYEARVALYSVIGVTIGMGGGALLAGSLTLRASTRARNELDAATRAECP